MSRVFCGVFSTALILAGSLVTSASVREESIPPRDHTADKTAVTLDRHGADPGSPFANSECAAEATEKTASKRSYLSKVTVYDNGDTDHGCCSEVTAHTLAEDFELSAAGTVSAATFVLQALPGYFPGNWDGTMSWWIYADAGGQPGTVLASGVAENLVWGLEQCCDYYDVNFDLGTDVPLAGETRYWFGIHMAADWSGEVGLYWSLTDPGNYSTAYTATSATGPWSDSAHHLAFTLRGTTTADDSRCLEVLFSWTYGSGATVAVSGSHAYFANGTYLQVADISTITNPQVVGELDLNSEFWGVDVSGNHLLIPTLDGELLILDISTPAAPTLTSAIRLVGSGFEILVDGSVAYLSGSRGMSIFDITTVTSPVQIGFYPTDDPAYAVSIQGTTAYISAFEDGLHVVDVTDQTAPSRLGHLPIAGYQEYVTSVPGYAFLADGADTTTDWTGHFRVIDVSTPSAPFEVTSLGGYGWLEAITMWGDYAIVSMADDGLHIIDVSTPAAPTDVGDVELPGVQMYAATTATHALTADWAGAVHLIDLDPVNAPTEVAEGELPGGSTGLAFLDDDTLVVAGIGRLRVYDVSNPAASSVTASIDVSANSDVNDIEIVGDLAILASLNEQITVIDLSDPANPAEIGSVPVWGTRRIVVSGNYVYVAANDRFEVVDITTPSTPTIHGTGYDMTARDVGIIGDTAFVASRISGLQCLDISSPDAPTLIGSLINDLDAFSIGTWGDQVGVGGRLISTLEGAWMIADVKTPTSPNPLATGSAPRLLYSMVTADDLLFQVAHGPLEVLDVKNARMPIRVASTDEVARGVGEPDAASGLIAVSYGRAGGFHLVDYSGCADIVIFVDGFETGDTTVWSSGIP